MRRVSGIVLSGPTAPLMALDLAYSFYIIITLFARFTEP